MTVMEDRLYAEGHDRDKLAASMKARGGTDASLSKLVNGKSRAPRNGIDAVVDAYAQMIGCDPLELWTGALARWVEVRPREDAWVVRWRDEHANKLRRRTAEMGRAAKEAKANQKTAKRTTR